jgi:hypothetical protein
MDLRTILGVAFKKIKHQKMVIKSQKYQLPQAHPHSHQIDPL